jgi:hypothetical protein
MLAELLPADGRLGRGVADRSRRGQPLVSAEDGLVPRPQGRPDAGGADALRGQALPRRAKGTPRRPAHGPDSFRSATDCDKPRESANAPCRRVCSATFCIGAPLAAGASWAVASVDLCAPPRLHARTTSPRPISASARNSRLISTSLCPRASVVVPVGQVAQEWGLLNVRDGELSPLERRVAI